MNILCPECGGNKIIDLGNNMYECRYCGKKFEYNSIQQTDSYSSSIDRQQSSLQQSQQKDANIGKPQPVYTQQPQPVYTQQPQPVYTQQPQSAYTQQPQPVYTQQPQPVFVQQQINATEPNNDQYEDELECGPGCFTLGISFFIPIIGFILFFVKRKSQPIYAKYCLQYAVISVILNFIIGIITRVLITKYLL